FTQPFFAGVTLSFRVNLTTNVDSGLTPDAFSFAILDNTLTPLPTTGLGDALLLVNNNSSKPQIETFPTTDGTAIQPRFNVPETGSSFAMLLIGLGAVWCLRRRFLHAAMTSLSVETVASPAFCRKACSSARQARTAHLTRCGNFRTPCISRRSPSILGASALSSVTSR